MPVYPVIVEICVRKIMTDIHNMNERVTQDREREREGERERERERKREIEKKRETEREKERERKRERQRERKRQRERESAWELGGSLRYRNDQASSLDNQESILTKARSSSQAAMLGMRRDREE